MQVSHATAKSQIKIFSEIQANEFFMNQLFRDPFLFGVQYDRLMTKYESANEALYQSIDWENLDYTDDLIRYVGGFRSSFNSHPR